jgi:hypothetical protein
MPPGLPQQDKLFQDHPELLLDRRVTEKMISEYLVYLSTGGEVKGFTPNPNGGQGSG